MPSVEDRLDKLTNEFYHSMLKVERRVTRLEILVSAQIILLIVTLIKTILG